MKRFAGPIALVLVVTSCGGGSDDDPDGGPGDSGRATSTVNPGQSSSDGTRLLVPGVLGGVDVVDLDAETQEPFIADLGQATNLQLVGETLWFVDGTALVAADASSGDVLGRVSAPNGVVDIAVDGKTAWVLTGIAGASTEVAVIDLQTMTQQGSIVAPESTTYRYIAAQGGNVWTFGGDVESSTAVSKLDAASFTQTTSVDTGMIADSMAASQDAIWIGGTIPAFFSDSGNPESGIVKIDPGSGAVIKTIPLGEPADHIVVAFGFDHMWATKGFDGTLYKIDPGSGEIINSIDTGAGAGAIPLEIIFTKDLLWVFNTTDDAATAFDPTSLELKDGINVPTFAPAPIFAP